LIIRVLKISTAFLAGDIVSLSLLGRFLLQSRTDVFSIRQQSGLVRFETRQVAYFF
jgi:hypothetical protein